jgi:hypothetical protein
LKNRARIDPEEERDEDQRDAADAAAGNAPRNTKPTTVFDVLTFLLVT